jgi:hypothetical protein
LSIFCSLPLMVNATPTRPEFRQEIMEHRTRVKFFLKKIIKYHPDKFASLMSLPEEIGADFLNSYIETHDIPKILSLQELQDWGYTGDRSFFEKLYDNYGKDNGKRPRYIDSLNDVEDLIKKSRMERFEHQLGAKLFTACMEELHWGENIADFTDAKVKRGPELGFIPKPFEAEFFMVKLPQGEAAAKISKWIEVKYFKNNQLNFCESHFSGFQELAPE